jgi:Flp pilus assembly secretin CpaC/tetratricopeptide (TPR) repeat protein
MTTLFRYKEGIVQITNHSTHVCRAVATRLLLILGLVAAWTFNLSAAPAPPPVPAPALDIPRLIEAERLRLEAERIAARKPAEPKLIGPPFMADKIEENRKLLPGWVSIAQTAEKEGRLQDAIDMYKMAFDKMQQDEVMPFMPAVEIKPLAEGLMRIQLQKATAALQDHDYNRALIAIAELQAWMPEAESTNPFLARAADMNRQVEIAQSDYKRRSPSRDALTRLGEIRGNRSEIERLLRDGMILYDAKDYDTANTYFERVSYLDPLNDRAEQYLKRIHNVRGLITDKRREQQFRERVHEVGKAWINDNRRHNLPIPNPHYRGPKGLNIQPAGGGGGGAGGGGMGGMIPKFKSKVQSNLGAAKVHQKLATILVPEIKALNGLTLVEVTTLLDQAVRDADPLKQGVNFRINTTIPWNLRQPRVQVGLGVPLAAAQRPRVNANGLPILPDVQSQGSASGPPAPGAAPKNPIPAKPAPVAPAPALVSSSETIDPERITISGLTTPMRDLTVGALLDAISDSFNVPIKHEVTSFGVTFSYRGPETEELFTRKFEVNGNAFMHGLGLPHTRSYRDGIKPRGVELTPVKPHQFNSATASMGRNGQMPVFQPQNDGIYNKQSGGLQFGIAPGGGGGGAPGGGAGGGAGAGGGNTLLNNTAASQAIESLLRNQYGLNVQVFFNDRRGIMLVRGPLSDLELVEQILDVFNASPPQVKLEAKFAEIEYDDNNALGFDWFLGNFRALGDKIITAPGTAPTYIGEPSRNNPSGFFPFPGTLQVDQFVPSTDSISPRSTDGHITSNFKQHGNPMMTFTGILTDPQFRMVLSAMDQKEGVDVLSAPHIITVSGRPATLNVQDTRYIVTGVTPAFTPGSFGGGGAGAMMPNVTTGQFGPDFQAVPYVSSDMYTIEMQVQPTFTEFLGYEDTTFEATAFAGGNTVTQPIALPRFRTRTLNVDCVVWDGYTLALGGLIAETVLTNKDKVPFLGDIPFLGGLFRGESTQRKKKNMAIYVTTTIIDPAGNPVNTEETLPFMRQPDGEVPNFRGLQP